MTKRKRVQVWADWDEDLQTWALCNRVGVFTSPRSRDNPHAVAVLVIDRGQALDLAVQLIQGSRDRKDGDDPLQIDLYGEVTIDR